MKRLLVLLLTFCIVSAFSIPVGATNNVSEIQMQTISKLKASTFEDIPIFVVKTNENKELTEEQKKDICLITSDNCAGVSLNNSYKDYRIVKLNEAEKQNVLNSPVYSLTFQRIQELIDSGCTVKYINLYTNSSLYEKDSGNLNDPSYWENNYPYLGTYDGYKFLYVESSAGVESSEVEVGNISSSLKWNEIAKKTLQVVCDHYVGGAFYKSAKAVSNGLSTLFSFVETPLSVSYGSSKGYVRAKVSGDLYIRTVLIKDNLNRVNGYAYYNWGTTERFAAALRASAKMPYKQNASGTYEYRYPSYTYPTQNSNTSGYYGNTTLYRNVIDLYENTLGYFTYDESIDANNIVASLLS